MIVVAFQIAIMMINACDGVGCSNNKSRFRVNDKFEECGRLLRDAGDMAWIKYAKNEI